MTPAELRRLADRKMAAATALASDAARLRSQADELRGLLEPLVPISQRVWVGPAATDFEDQVRAQSARLDEEAGRLRQVAAELERRAGSERRAAADLRAQAAAAEVAALVTPGVV